MSCALQHLKEVVSSNTKFSFSENGRKIKTHHDHSIKIAMDN